MPIKRTLVIAVLAVGLLGRPAAGNEPAKTAVTPAQALAALTEGNARYAAGTSQDLRRDQARRCDTFANGQHPVAAVLSCADSRVPVEMIFDQGIGDVFAIRVAGNVAATDEVGTIEYGVEHLGTPLVVVLGHSKCGAVTAVAEKAEVHGCVAELVSHIAPAVDKATKQNPSAKGAALVSAAIRQNVWQSIEDLYARSPAVREAAAAGKIKVVGAIYDLHTGTVEWMGAHPQEQTLVKAAKSKAADPSASDKKMDGQGSKPAAPAPKPDGHSAAPVPATELPDTATAAREEAPTARVRPQKDNLPVLGAMLTGGAVVSWITIRLMERRA